MTGERTEDKDLSAVFLPLLIFIPIIGTGGTALVSYFKFFSIEEVILNTFAAASLCIVSEIPLRYVKVNRHGEAYFVWSYILGLILSLLSAFTFEFFLPLAAASVLIGVLSDTVTGIAALLLFSGISTLVLYEGGLYFFYIFFTGFVLLMFFSLKRRMASVSAAITSIAVSAVAYVSCARLAKIEFSPETVVFPVIGLFLNLLIIFIMLPKLYENVIFRRAIFINKILDPEYELLQSLKQENRREYDKVIHGVHLANILQERLKLERIKLLGTAYYARIGVLRGENENIETKTLSLLHERKFPSEIVEGVKEYYSLKDLKLSKESSSVLIINRLIAEIYKLKDSDSGEKDYNRIVTTVMKEMTGDKRILQSELSLGDLSVISEALRKQVFYYDLIL